MIVALAAVAGGFGAWARDALLAGLRRGRRAGSTIALLVVNGAGSFALGWVVTRASADLRAVVGTGFLGGFTTYSAFALETVEVYDARGRVPAAAQVIASVVVGAVAAALGIALGGGW